MKYQRLDVSQSTSEQRRERQTGGRQRPARVASDRGRSAPSRRTRRRRTSRRSRAPRRARPASGTPRIETQWKKTGSVQRKAIRPDQRWTRAIGRAALGQEAQPPVDPRGRQHLDAGEHERRRREPRLRRDRRREHGRDDVRVRLRDVREEHRREPTTSAARITRRTPIHCLAPRARSSGDRARASGARGRRFESCRAHDPLDAPLRLRPEPARGALPPVWHRTASRSSSSFTAATGRPSTTARS